eukprot:scaffold195566_cov36-Prasinocladus_malaysianus.AAC.1
MRFTFERASECQHAVLGMAFLRSARGTASEHCLPKGQVEQCAALLIVHNITIALCQPHFLSDISASFPGSSRHNIFIVRDSLDSWLYVKSGWPNNLSVKDDATWRVMNNQWPTE